MLMQEIYNKTVQIEDLLGKQEQVPRETFIKQLQHLLDERGRLLSRLSGTCSADERAIGQHIMEINQRINQQLRSIRQDIVQEMQQFKHRKRTVSRYRNPYTGPTKDGMYLDKRE